MLLRTFFDPKLAHTSYLVACQQTNEAIVIDPARTIDAYLETAKAEGVHIVAVTETHIHADFLSGARELAEQVGAKLYLSGAGGPDWQYEYAYEYLHHLLQDGDSWELGKLRFEALHTPGHTPEHMAYLLTDCANTMLPIGIFSGDCVFVGDVGRPDLLERSVGIKGSKAAAAQQLFGSVQRIKQLPDYVQLWPAHGAGSACGKALGAVPSSTVGYEQHTNWAFQLGDETAFVERVLDGQPEPPLYFATMKRLNKKGPDRLNAHVEPKRLDIKSLLAIQQTGAPIVDTRSPAEFADGHVPGTFNIPARSKRFTTYAGWFLEGGQPFYLIIDPADVPTAIADLARIGLDKVSGIFGCEVIAEWSRQTKKPLGKIEQIMVTDVVDAVESGQLMVIDVRGESEFASGHLPNAHNIMLGYVLDGTGDIPTNRPVLFQCKSGFRSSIAAGLLASQGYAHVFNLVGGYDAWQQAGLPVVVPGQTRKVEEVEAHAVM